MILSSNPLLGFKIKNWSDIMFENLKGKKLLIIGGVKMSCDFVVRAQKMGVYVVVADYLIESPAKKVADKGVLIDALDVDALVQFCIEEKIDGITTGYVDILLPICHEVCMRLGLPYYATEEMIDVSTNKISFKRMCNDYRVPVPVTYEVNAESYIKEAEDLCYPVFVKPLDASGSRGASVCRTSEEFISNYQIALGYSEKQQVIVEEYLEGTEFIMDYLMIDGEPHLMSMFDRKMCSNRPSAVNHSNLLISPSHKLDDYIREIHPNVSEMFKGTGFQSGLLFLQGYIDGDKITFYEMGCRLGGTFPNIVEKFTGINPMDVLIHHALTGDMLPKKTSHKITPYFNGKGAVVNFILNDKKGKINKISGLDEILKMSEVVNCIQFMNEGDEFELGNFTDQPIVILYMAAPDLKSLKDAVNKVYTLFKCVDCSNKSLLMPLYSLDDIDDTLYI